ncbi:MAG: hypothetical protein RDU14_15440 [Melioribacteraceae bacterium]|nr:hypothetical protein [Melioribacteraceae bacterium]
MEYILKNRAEKEGFLKALTNNQVLLIPENDLERETLLQISEITIDTKLTSNFNQDIWTIDSKGFFFTKMVLDKIAKAGGVKFIDSTLLLRNEGEDKRATYVKHKIKYECLNPDGTSHLGSVTGEYSYYDDLQRIKYQSEIMVNNKILHRKGEIIQDLINQRRNYSGSVAEGNAKRKALSEIFPRLKKPFYLSELSGGILVGKIRYNTKLILKKNPELRRAYVASMLNIGRLISYTHHDLKTDFKEIQS